MTLDEELKKQLKECERLNQIDFCNSCVRSTVACDNCRYELNMKSPTLHLTGRELREILSYQDDVDLIGGYLND